MTFYLTGRKKLKPAMTAAAATSAMIEGSNPALSERQTTAQAQSQQQQQQRGSQISGCETTDRSLLQGGDSQLQLTGGGTKGPASNSAAGSPPGAAGKRNGAEASSAVVVMESASASASASAPASTPTILNEQIVKCSSPKSTATAIATTATSVGANQTSGSQQTWSHHSSEPQQQQQLQSSRNSNNTSDRLMFITPARPDPRLVSDSNASIHLL